MDDGLPEPFVSLGAATVHRRLKSTTRFAATGCVALAAALTMAIAAGGGCNRSPRAERHAATFRAGTNSGAALLENVVETLNHLDRDINLELRPPKVVLDASKSKDLKDVLATLGENPRNPTGRFDYVDVPQQNSQFRKIGVKPGDRVRYYVSNPTLATQITVLQSSRFRQLIRQGTDVDQRLVQSWIDEELENLGETRTNYFEMPVWRVVSESALLVQGGLPVEIRTAERLEIWRYAGAKMEGIEQRFRRYVLGRGGVLGWEPSPDEAVLQQVVERLNQWMRRSRPTGEWRLDPLVESLPDDLQRFAATDSLAATRFRPYDGRLLQEVVWLRDIGRWAAGDRLDDLDQATQLFDWTVRNIQLELSDALHNRPWQTLLYGRGTAAERAWVFAVLCRQRGLDVVMLARADPAHPERWIDWLPALLSGGELHLFDPELGLPIPGPGGQGIATLSQVAADDGLLRHLDLDDQHPYPVTASQLDQVVAQIPAAPVYLSKRMRLLQSQLAGDKRLVLSIQPSALAERLRQSDRIGPVRLWQLPYRSTANQLARQQTTRRTAVEQFRVFAWRPMLWKARVRHFQGMFDGDEGAKAYYRQARPADEQIKAMEGKATEQAVRTIRTGKISASYWLGLLTYDDGQTDVAIDYLDRRTLLAHPDGPWTAGAGYNLGRTYEATGRLDEATQRYRTDQSPQRHGNRLRARWLDRSAVARGEPALPAGPECPDR